MAGLVCKRDGCDNTFEAWGTKAYCDDCPRRKRATCAHCGGRCNEMSSIPKGKSRRCRSCAMRLRHIENPEFRIKALAQLASVRRPVTKRRPSKKFRVCAADGCEREFRVVTGNQYCDSCRGSRKSSNCIDCDKTITFGSQRCHKCAGAFESEARSKRSKELWKCSDYRQRQKEGRPLSYQKRQANDDPPTS